MAEDDGFDPPAVDLAAAADDGSNPPAAADDVDDNSPADVKEPEVRIRFQLRSLR